MPQRQSFLGAWIIGFSVITISISSQRIFATIYEQSTQTFITQINNSNSAVAIMLPVLHLLPNPDRTFRLENFEMENSWNLCSGEALEKAPPLVTSCSGFLIAPDILMTAGHCMINNRGEVRDVKNAQCEAFSFVFGYHYEDEQKQKLAPIQANQIVNCKKIIYAAQLTTTNPLTGKLSFGKDIAYIQLDRKMPYQPFTVAENISNNKNFAASSISMLGHPFGMPMLESKGTVLEPKNGYLRAAINSFPSHSGAAVKNKFDEVIGLLVRGYPDSFIEDHAHKCSVHNRCDAKAEKCKVNDPLEIAGEHIQLIETAELRSIVR